MTDRQRLCPGADRHEQLSCLREQIQHAVAAGIDVIQIRERDLPGRELAGLVREAVARARGTKTRIVVNDRLDVALSCGAAGVHLRGDSVPAASVRHSVPPGFLIGTSVRSAAGASEAAVCADYLIAGTVWPTASKPGLMEGLGEAGLKAIVQAAGIPVLAIGGVDLNRLPQVAAAGAAGVAAIGLFTGDNPGQRCRAVPVARIVRQAHGHI